MNNGGIVFTATRDGSTNKHQTIYLPHKLVRTAVLRREDEAFLRTRQYHFPSCLSHDFLILRDIPIAGAIILRLLDKI